MLPIQRSIKIIQHNVLKWSFSRRNELTNYYQKEDADVILLNATGLPNMERIKIYQYNTYQRNNAATEHAGIATAIKNSINRRILDDFAGDVLAIRIETTNDILCSSKEYGGFSDWCH